MIQFIPYSIAILDRDMRFLAVSDQWFEIMGVQKFDILGQYYYDVIPETLNNFQWVESQKRALAGYVEKSAWDLLIRPDGHIDYIKWENRPWYLPDGTIGGIMMFSEALTGIFETKRILEQQYLLLKSIEEKSKIGYWRYDILSNQLLWSDQIYKMHGLSPQNFVPTLENAIQLYHPDDIPIVQTTVNEAIHKAEPFEFQLRVIKPDHTITFVHAYGYPLQENDKTIAILGCVGDVTETFEKEKEIHRQKDFFKQIINEIPDLIVVKDKDLLIRHANKAFLAAYNTSEQQIIGTKTLKGLLPGQNEKYLQEDKMVLENGVFQGLDETLFPAQTNPKIIYTKKVSFKDCAHDQYILSISQDLTELVTAKKELEKSNQELENFAQIISHDLKEPLRGINNYSMMLRTELQSCMENNPVYAHMLDRISILCRKMNTLLDELLYYSQVGRVGLAFQSTPINTIINTVIDFHQEKIQAENVELIVQPNMPTLEIDHVRLGEVFSNLIINAIKYNTRKLKRIEIGVTSHPKAPNQPVFFVKDNGIGIKEKFYDDIFAIFHRLHSRDQYGGGSGSGLTIVKKIIECHGGNIWVESQFGTGTTFFFTLQSPQQSSDTCYDFLQSHPEIKKYG